MSTNLNHTMTPKINPYKHLRNLIFFNFNRYKGDNYSKMREYFAEITINDLRKLIDLSNKKILDVGGADGSFCKYLFETKKCDAINLDPFPPEKIVWKTIKSNADKIPFKEDYFDAVLCRNVLEHIPNNKQQKSLNEIYRVLKRGGIIYVVIPPWFNPHAGHRFKPFHIFPFKMAKYLRELIFREKIDYKSFEEYSLYKITFEKMKRMIKKSGFQILDTKDTHFRMHFLTKIPIIREILVPAVGFIGKKPLF